MPSFLAEVEGLFWQYVVNGVVVGSIIAITSVGLTLVYSILKLTNFAHGDVVTLGAYTALFANLVLGLSPWAALLTAAVAGVGICLLLEFLVWRRMRALGAGTVSRIVASIGVALVIRNLIVFAFGPQAQSYNVPLTLATRLGPLPAKLTPDQKTVIAAALLGVLLVHLVLRYTSIGKAMRALSDNRDLAWVCGIDVDRVILWTWVLGGGLAAIGGVLYGFTRPIHPNLGWFLLLPMFAAVILGGIGNAYGAILGGFIIGIAQEVSVMLIRNEYKVAVGFLVMILVLLVRPRGLLGETRLR